MIKSSLEPLEEAQVFENFTPRARKAISLSQQHALGSKSSTVDTEHLLLGIVDEGGGIPAKIFKRRSIGFKSIIDEIRNLSGKSVPAEAPAGQPPFSPAAQKAFELAEKAANDLNQKMVNTEHLLIGLIEEGTGTASKVLSKLGFKPADLRAEAVIASVPEAKPPPPRPIQVGVLSPIVAAPPAQKPVETIPPPPPVPTRAPTPIPVPVENALAPLVDSLPSPEPLIVIPEVPKVPVPEGFDPVEWFHSVLATCSAAEEIARMTKEKLIPAMEALNKFAAKKQEKKS